METQEDIYIGFLNDFYGRGLLIHFSYLLSVFGILFLTTWMYFNRYFEASYCSNYTNQNVYSNANSFDNNRQQITLMPASAQTVRISAPLQPLR